MYGLNKIKDGTEILNLEELYETKENYDIELKSREGDKVKAHKSVLKIKSEYFNKLLSEKHKDNGDGICGEF